MKGNVRKSKYNPAVRALALIIAILMLSSIFILIAVAIRIV